MFKTGLFSIVITTSLIATLLTSCGFHVPRQNTNLNATISAENNNAFADELAKRFNKKAVQSLVIQIGNETKKIQNSSYNSSGKVSSYRVNFSVPIKVFNNKKQLLLSEHLTASTHLNTINETQAERLQTTETYAQLRNDVIKRLLRRLNSLNEN